MRKCFEALVVLVEVGLRGESGGHVMMGECGLDKNNTKKVTRFPASTFVTYRQ